jgi:choline-sulfatase
MGFLGSQRGLTPNLDSLSHQSVVFARAYAQVPLTTPSHAAIMTGTYPQFNHLVDLGMPLSKDLPYLPDLLHQRGYRTAAFVGAMILDPKGPMAPGFTRGFEIYDAGFHKREPGENRYKSVERRAGDVVDRALTWLMRSGPGPFFLWIHVYDPHDPYDPPEPFKTRYVSEPYDGEIAYTDSEVGKLFAGLRNHGLYENTVIAVMADHGEAFGEHGEQRHGMFLYDETIHVPLLVKFPREHFAGKRIADRARLVDVAPTILKETGITVPSAMQGQALQDLITAANRSDASGAGFGDRSAYAETDYPHRAFGWSPLQSWRAGKYLYIQAPKRELYDQVYDPSAQHNIAANSSAVSDTVASGMREFVQTTSSKSNVQAQIDPAQAEQLRALGYLASDSKVFTERGGDAGIDPKDKIQVANRLHEALVDTENDDYEAAIPKLQKVIQEEPNTHAAYLELGRVWIHEKQYDKALPVLQKAVDLTPDSPMALYELGLALVKTGQWEAAVSPFEGAVAHAPNSAEMHFYLGAVFARLKQLPEAAREFDAALQLDPSHYQANLIYGHMLVLEHEPEAALPKLQKAAKLKPDLGEPHKYLAEAYFQLGQQANADRERALADRLRPGAP